MIKKILFLAALMFSSGALSKTITIDMNADNTINLNGVVTPRFINPLTDKLFKLAGTKVVNIVINSPGGYVYEGQKFVQAMIMAKSRGTRVDCVVTGMAASMGFQILSFCDNRYVLSYSLLLWHPPRVQTNEVITPGSANSLAEDLERIDDALYTSARDNLNAPDDWYMHHHIRETMWFGSQLQKALPKAFTVVDDVVGLDTLKLNIPSFFGFGFEDSGIIYINPNLDTTEY